MGWLGKWLIVEKGGRKMVDRSLAYGAFWSTYTRAISCGKYAYLPFNSDSKVRPKLSQVSRRIYSPQLRVTDIE